MDTRTHGIKIGDLVKFKHHMFDDGLMPVHLVTQVLASPDLDDGAMNIRLHGTSGITHRATAFVVVKRV